MRWIITAAIAACLLVCLQVEAKATHGVRGLSRLERQILAEQSRFELLQLQQLRELQRLNDFNRIRQFQFEQQFLFQQPVFFRQRAAILDRRPVFLNRRPVFINRQPVFSIQFNRFIDD